MAELSARLAPPRDPAGDAVKRDLRRATDEAIDQEGDLVGIRAKSFEDEIGAGAHLPAGPFAPARTLATVRVGLSVALFLLIMLGWAMGWVRPGGIPSGG